LSALSETEENDMRTLNNTKFLMLLTTLILLVSACGPRGSTPDAAATFNPLVTAAAQTMEALLTQAAVQPGSQPTATQNPGSAASPVPLNTLEPTQTVYVVPSQTPYPTAVPFTPTPYYTATPVTKCDWVSFIADVTVPDGTVYNPGATIVKTWRLKNIGTCTWTTAYSLVFLKGDQMGAAVSIPLTANVGPNQTVDLSVTMTAPADVKAYRGYWMLRNAASAMFGFGPNADSSFWADIKVVNPAVTAIAYDFVANYCAAGVTWLSSVGGVPYPALPCPGTTSDVNGFVVKLTSPQLENNTAGIEAALLIRPPQTVNDGTISGTYPAFDVKSGDRFMATVGCQYGSVACFVKYRLDYQVGADPVKTLATWDEKYDNQTYAWNVDLTPLAGKSVKFILTIFSVGSPTQDDALWSAARIVRTTPVSSTGACQIVSQTTNPSKASFAAGPADTQDIDFIWNIKNTGLTAWAKTEVDWNYVSGTKMHKVGFGDVRDLPADVAAGGTIQLIMDAFVPASNGTYSETWALYYGGAPFCNMAVTIKVGP
jgi:hypothetical protein